MPKIECISSEVKELNKVKVALYTFAIIDDVFKDVKFTTSKQYNDLYDLHCSLSNVFSGNLPTFPGKVYFGNHLTDNVMSKRKKELTDYLNAVLSIPGLTCYTMTMDFLKKDSVLPKNTPEDPDLKTFSSTNNSNSNNSSNNSNTSTTQQGNSNNINNSNGKGG